MIEDYVSCFNSTLRGSLNIDFNTLKRKRVTRTVAGVGGFN